MIWRSAWRLAVQGAKIEHWRRVQIVGIHEMGDALKCRQDEGLFPVLKRTELACKLILQRQWRLAQGHPARTRELNDDLAPVVL